MKLKIEVKGREHILDFGASANVIARGTKRTGNALRHGISSILGTATAGLNKIQSGVQPGQEYLLAIQKEAEEKARVKAEIAKRKAELKELKHAL